MKNYEPFKVTRLPIGGGPDIQGQHLFCVTAKGNHELIRTGETSHYTHLTGFSHRSEAKALCDMLNATYQAFQRGARTL